MAGNSNLALLYDFGNFAKPEKNLNFQTVCNLGQKLSIAALLRDYRIRTRMVEPQDTVIPGF